MMIASIVMLGAGGVLTYGTKNFRHYAEAAEADRIGEGLCRLIGDRLKYAEDIRISGDYGQHSADASIRFGKDGRCYMDGRDLYEDAFYQNRKLGCTILAEEAPAGVLLLEVWMKDDRGAVLYQNRMAVNCMNMKLTGEDIRFQPEEKAGLIDSGDQDVAIRYRTNKGETNE